MFSANSTPCCSSKNYFISAIVQEVFESGTENQSRKVSTGDEYWSLTDQNVKNIILHSTQHVRLVVQ